MFDIGWSELLVIGVVALIAIGPKELPGVLRAVGQWTGKIRRMASEFQSQFQEAMREAELTDVKKQFDEATDFNKYNPLAEAQKSIEDLSIDSEPKPPVQVAEPNAPSPDQPAPVSEAKIDVPLPEPPEPVTNADFAPKPDAETSPEPKKAESGA